MDSRRQILGEIRQALGHGITTPVPPRPPIVGPRVPGPVEEEVDRLLGEVRALGGHAARVADADLPAALSELVRTEAIRRAVLWRTSRLERLGVATQLQALGVEVLPTDADKQLMATADLGITEADFALPETGTLGLLSAPDRPRSVSLLPRIHLALVEREALRADLHAVFQEARPHNYLILITGPSRTADIELVVTIGVHGPGALYVWI